ncbi:MAG: hypothetical protein U1F27_02690 [Turneriella sp.]
MRLAALAIFSFVFAGCTVQDDEAKKSGICIHGTSMTPKATDCTTCAAPPAANCDNKYYTYCTNEKKSDNCKNLSAICNTSMTTKGDYDDVITYYDGNKKCDTSGYTLTCPGNSSYFVSDLTFCPP